MSAGIPRHRALTLLVMLAVCLPLTACVKRRVAVTPGATAYPEYVFPADRGEPASVSARIDTVWQRLQINDLRGATREVRAALEEAPASVAARTAQGYVALANRLPDVALRAFDASLAVRPSYAPALAGRGHALLAQQKDFDALVAFDAAIVADASLTEVKRRADVVRLRIVDAAVADARAARKAGRLDEARARYGRALQASPESAFLYRERAAVARAQHDDAAAVADLRRAVVLEPSDADGLAALAAALAASGQLREAESAYRRAFALDASDTIRAGLADVTARLRDNQLPEEVRAIESKRQLTRGDLAALLGVRFETLLRGAPAVPLVITDLHDDWTRPRITSITSAGVMEPYPNHTFQPSAPAVRADMAAASLRLLALAAPTRPALRKLLQERPVIADVSPSHPLYSAAASAVASGALPLADGGRFEASRALAGAEASAAVRRLRAVMALE